jgi:hypothetical protein
VRSSLDEAFIAIGDRLGVRGWRKRGVKGVFTKELAPDTLGWIGLNSAREGYRGAVAIGPAVGVRNQAVERLVARLSGATFHPFLPPTVVQQLGYLLPARGYKAWVFTDESFDSSADELVECVDEHGLPDMLGLTDLAALRARTEVNWEHDQQAHYRVPVLRLLTGDRVGALAALDRVETLLVGRDDPAAQLFRSYERAFRDEVTNR